MENRNALSFLDIIGLLEVLYFFRENVCCLDYSVASYKGNGTLAAYRFDGEQTLDNRKIVYV